ncbi:hypothetical protein [Mycobacterium avium]|uniref:hypothetical protein n=1 Tax=Mycobacterium avium TaxID=1764 RepID=UPI001E31AC8C|nr:hypothetical protein [Mycobacterium avium]
MASLNPLSWRRGREFGQLCQQYRAGIPISHQSAGDVGQVSAFGLRVGAQQMERLLSGAAHLLRMMPIA